MEVDKVAEAFGKLTTDPTSGLTAMARQFHNVTAEQIADYRENVAPLIYVIRQNVFLNADTSATSEINKLLMQYIEGAVNLDSLVRELDQRVRLMQLEDQ